MEPVFFGLLHKTGISRVGGGYVHERARVGAGCLPLYQNVAGSGPCEQVGASAMQRRR